MHDFLMILASLVFCLTSMEYEGLMVLKLKLGVVHHEASSEWKEGVFQGFILGQLLFVLFVNDPSNVVQDCLLIASLCSYADDTMQ